MWCMCGACVVLATYAMGAQKELGMHIPPKHHLSAARALWQSLSKILSKHHLSAARSLWQTQSKILSKGRSGRLGRKNHVGLPENTPGGGPVCLKKSQHASKQRPPHPPDFNIEVRAASRDIFQNKKNELRELPRQC